MTDATGAGAGIDASRSLVFTVPQSPPNRTSAHREHATLASTRPRLDAGGTGFRPSMSSKILSTSRKASSFTERYAEVALLATAPEPSRTMNPLHPSCPHDGMSASSAIHVTSVCCNCNSRTNASASAGPAQLTHTNPTEPPYLSGSAQVSIMLAQGQHPPQPVNK